MKSPSRLRSRQPCADVRALPERSWYQLYSQDRACKRRGDRGQLRGRRAAAPPSAAGRTAPSPLLAASWLERSPSLHRLQQVDGRQQCLLTQRLAGGAPRWPPGQPPRRRALVRPPAGSASPDPPASGAGQALPPQARAASRAQHCCCGTGPMLDFAGPQASLQRSLACLLYGASSHCLGARHELQGRRRRRAPAPRSAAAARAVEPNAQGRPPCFPGLEDRLAPHRRDPPPVAASLACFPPTYAKPKDGMSFTRIAG